MRRCIFITILLLVVTNLLHLVLVGMSMVLCLCRPISVACPLWSDLLVMFQ
uniref:Uncharacterized protein n=1 Tax=Arundo donax TaxID=35708 RepID=A0A0A9DRM4_ARUDO